MDIDDNINEEDITATEKKIYWYDRVLLNRPSKVVLALILASIVTPLLLYQFVFISRTNLPPQDGFSLGSCVISRTARLPCGVGSVTEEECHTQCCYDYANNFCFHRLPSRFSYLFEGEWSEDVVLTPRISTTPFKSQDSLKSIRLSIDEVSATHLTLTFYDSTENSLNGTRIDNKNYTYEIISPEMDVEVNGPQGMIFHTIRGPLIAANDIWEIAFKLTEESMYGLGDIPLERETTKVIYNHKGGFSSIPLIFARFNGSYHGLLIETNTPTEVTVDGENQILVRSITSSGLKFHIFTGPQPKDITREVMEHLEYDNQVLQYWMLGAHVCSETSVTVTGAFDELNEFMTNASRSKFPFESHCGTAPIVFDNHCEPETLEYVEKGANLLKYYNKRFVAHVSPYIRYEEDNETESEETENDAESRSDGYCSHNIVPDFAEFMLQDPQTSNVYIGLVEDYGVIYPDYGNVTDEFMKTLWRFNITLDGVILVNSWPLDESYKFHNETYLSLPYFSENFEEAFNHTPQWNVTRQDNEKYLYKHNEYANSFIQAFRKVSDDNLPVWSSSQWFRNDVVINRQSVDISWTNLRREIIEAALGGVSGHLLWSSPICGDTDTFDSDTQIDLCTKWYMAATYLPMIKIHSKLASRDPLSFIGTHQIHMMTALNRRMSFLPYFYTILQEGPLLRPMFYQFPSSESLSDLISQFCVGEDLLIVPNLQPSQSHVHVWLPPGVWFELWGGLKLEGEEGEAITMTTTDSDFLTLIRGGSVLIMQKANKETAEETRLHSDYSLTIALICETTNSTDPINPGTITDCEATGELYMTEQMTITFEADANKLSIETRGDDFKSFCDVSDSIWAHVIKEINIYGLEDKLNNYDHHKHIDTSIDLCELESKDGIVYNF